MITLTEAQEQIRDLPQTGGVFISGPSGCGKTTAVCAHIASLMQRINGWEEILVITPSSVYAQPYREIAPERGILPRVTTFNSFIQSCIDIFWPLLSRNAGFGRPESPPIYLTIETAQILMAKLIDQKIDSGYFATLSIPKSRLYNQIMLGLHKTAAACLKYSDYALRMRQSWSGEKTLLSVFDQAQECGELFRRQCLEANLLDYSIQTEIFTNYLLPSPFFHLWLEQKKIHFIFDNAEEDVPAAHAFAKAIIPICQSSLIICDDDGGFRNFLGSDALSARRLRERCGAEIRLTDSFIMTPPVSSLIEATKDPQIPITELPANPRKAFRFHAHHQYPDMIRQAAIDCADLIQSKGVPPSEIVIIAPLISDVLYTAMERELRQRRIPVYVHRPSRPLNREPITKSFLTLAMLARADCGAIPRLLDIVQMLQVFIPGLDPIRGHLLTGKAFTALLDQNKKIIGYKFNPFQSISKELRTRITPELGDSYEKIRAWLEREVQAKNDPDSFIPRFFIEVLTLPSFNHGDEILRGLQKVSESLLKYRKLLSQLSAQGVSLLTWKDYFNMADLGMVSAQYHEEWFQQPKGTVLISLATAFIMRNQPVDCQIWLNAGSPRWWERFYSQLTNDVVLSQNWEEGAIWDAKMAFDCNDEHLYHLLFGLLRRCRQKILVYASEINEAGQDQKSKLLYIFSDLAYRFSALKTPLMSGAPTLSAFQENQAQSPYPGIHEEETDYGYADEDAQMPEDR